MDYFANMLKQLLTMFSQYTLNLPHMVSVGSKRKPVNDANLQKFV